MANALQTAQDIRVVANLFSGIADEYNTRLQAEAANLSSGEIYARLQEDQRLRSIANQLYFEANDLILADAVDDQAKLEASLTAARAKLKTLQDFSKALTLFADLLVLAGAILTEKPNLILPALKEVRNDTAQPDAEASLGGTA